MAPVFAGLIEWGAGSVQNGQKAVAIELKVVDCPAKSTADPAGVSLGA